MLARVALLLVVLGVRWAESVGPESSRFLHAAGGEDKRDGRKVPDDDVRMAASTKANASTAIAFAGGGFRAFALDVGLTVGLLAAKARRRNITTPRFNNTNFLERFGTISSNSGSTWFWSALAFSERFQTTLERMAVAPEASSNEFRRDWMQDWINIGHDVKEGLTPSEKDDVAGLLQAKGDFAIGQATKEIAFFWRRGLSWNDFVHLLLKTTASLDSLHYLGDPVPSWLEGKVWLSVHSVVTGTQKKEAKVMSSVGQSVHYHDRLSETYGDALPVYVPAKHSIVLGSGRSAAAPYPYFAESSGVSVRSLKYRGAQRLGLRQLHDETASLEQLGKNVERQSGSLPVSGVASASSAVAGGVCLSSSVSSTVGSLDAQLTPWAALALGGDAMFSRGAACWHDLENKGVSRGRLRVCARSGVAGVVDGGYTEGSGVAQAVSVGASEVVAVVNDLISISGLFQRDKGSSETVGIPRLHLPIFAEWYDESLFEDVRDLVIPKDSKDLGRFMVATIQGTTVRNLLFGIEEGRKITLRVIYVKTQLQIGVLSDYLGYCNLAQEIAQCMLSDENAEILEGWFLRYL